jgi:hypothetical protein
MSDTKNNIDWKTYSGTKLCINVNNSQVEIDGGYEGLETLSLIEAKNSLFCRVWAKIWNSIFMEGGAVEPKYKSCNNAVKILRYVKSSVSLTRLFCGIYAECII